MKQNDNEIIVGFKKLAPSAVIPTRAHKTDSGFDLYASERTVIYPESSALIKTDIAAVLPSGYDATIRNRSGITAKTSLRVQLGTIDTDYMGELLVLVDNIHPIICEHETGNVSYTNKYLSIWEDVIETIDKTYPIGTYIVEKGNRIAQLVIHPIPNVRAIEIVTDLNETDRGTNGIGSTDA